MSDRIDAIHELLGSIREELARSEGRLERRLDRIELSVSALAARAGTTETAGQAQDARVTALERRNADQDAGDKRQRRLFAATMAVFSTLAGVATWLVGQFFSST